jgi:hypothetical protein
MDLSGISLQDLIAEANERNKLAVGANTSIAGGTPPTASTAAPAQPPASGGAPFDIAELLLEVQGTVTDVNEKSAVLREKSAAATGRVEDLSTILKMQLESKTSAALDIAKISTKVSNKATELNSTPTNTFRNTVAGPEAAKNRETLRSQLTGAQKEYQDVVTRMESGNLFQKGFIQLSELPRATARLQQAQQNIQFEQQSASLGTQNYLNSINSSRAIAGQLSAGELAQAQEKANIADIMIEGIKAERSISKESVQNYAMQLNVEQSALEGAAKKLQIANEAGKLNAASKAVIMQDMADESLKMRLDRERKGFKTRDAYLERRDEQFNQMLTTDGRTDDIGKLTWETAVESNMNPNTNPLYARYLQWEASNGFSGDAYTEAFQASQSNRPLTATQNSILNAGQLLGQQHNVKIQQQMSAAGITQEAREALKAQLVDPNSPESVVVISKAYNTVKANAVNDATAAITSGVMIVPDMKKALTDPAYTDFQSQIPVELRAFLTEGEFKDIDFKIAGPEAAGQINGIIKQMLDGIERTTSTVVSSSPDVDRGATERATLRKAAKAVSSYFGAAREYSAVNAGLTNLKALRVQGISDLGATSWLSGMNDVKGVNLESADELESLMLDGLRARKAKRQSVERISSFGGINPQ